MTAKLPSNTFQETQYIYTDTGNNGVHSNDLLEKTEGTYPASRARK